MTIISPYIYILPSIPGFTNETSAKTFLNILQKKRLI